MKNNAPNTIEFKDGYVIMLHYARPLNDIERMEVVKMLMQQQEEKKKSKIKKLPPKQP